MQVVAKRLQNGGGAHGEYDPCALANMPGGIPAYCAVHVSPNNSPELTGAGWHYSLCAIQIEQYLGSKEQ